MEDIILIGLAVIVLILIAYFSGEDKSHLTKTKQEPDYAKLAKTLDNALNTSIEYELSDNVKEALNARNTFINDLKKEPNDLVKANEYFKTIKSADYRDYSRTQKLILKRRFMKNIVNKNKWKNKLNF